MTLFSPIQETDKIEVERWIAGEPSHSASTFEFYTETGCKSLMFSDEEGNVLVAKFTPSLRIDIDFNPEASPDRIKKVMYEGLANMEDQARKQGFKQLVFDSLSEKLVRFCSRLGFTSCPDYRKNI